MGRRMNNDYDDFDIEERHSHAKNKNRKVKRRKQKKSVGNFFFGFFLVLLVVVIICVGAYFAFGHFRNYFVDPFNEKIAEYQQVLEEYDAMEGEYLKLLDKAQKAAKGNNFIAYYKISREMKENANYLKKYRSGQKAIGDLRDEYMTRFANYRITDAYKATYDDLFKRLNAAMEDNDQSQLLALKKELNALEQNLKIDNENLIQSGKNEINHLGLTSADPAENALMEDYKNRVNTYVAEDNYAAALDILDEWKVLAGVTAERIAESESKAKATLESSRMNHEQEETEYFPGGYVFGDSNQRFLESEEIMELSRWGRKVALYEIYARHGCMFSDEMLKDYFSKQTWYKGTVASTVFQESEFNEYEAANVRLLKSFN